MRQFICLTLFTLLSISAFAQNSEKFIDQGIAYLDSNNIDSAISQFGKAIEGDKFNAVAHYNLGVCYIIKEEFSKSIPYLNKAILLDSQLFEARYNRALAYSQTQNFLFSLYDYEFYLNKVKNDSLAYYNKAMVHQKIGEFEECLKMLNKAIIYGPFYEDALFERATQLYSNRSFKEAQADIELCLNLDSSKLEYKKVLADVYYAQAKYHFAEELYDSLNSWNNEVYYLEQLAMCKMYLGKNWPALSLFSKLIRKDNTNYKYYYNRAFVYIKVDRNQKAEKDLTYAIENNSRKLGDFLNLRGLARYNLKKFDEACFDWHQASNMHHQEGKNNLNKYCKKR